MTGGGSDPPDDDREDAGSFNIDIPEEQRAEGGEEEPEPVDDFSSWESITGEGDDEDLTSPGENAEEDRSPTGEDAGEDRTAPGDAGSGDRTTPGDLGAGDRPAERSSAPTTDRSDDAGRGDSDLDTASPDVPPSGDHGRPDAPDPEETDDAVTPEEVGVLRWLWVTDDPAVATVREVVTSVGMVVVVGLVLFGISGVWPPLVAVESGSMEPHMHKGDLVFVVEDGRFAPQEAIQGVVTYRQGKQTGYWSFGNYGNVIVYQPNGRSGTPIIHRARFHVEKGEKWVNEANPEYLGGISRCGQIDTCPADHDGFITKGDNNAVYDQVAGRSDVVKSEWVTGVGKVRIPWLGCIRLELSGESCL